MLPQGLMAGGGEKRKKNVKMLSEDDNHLNDEYEFKIMNEE